MHFLLLFINQPITTVLIQSSLLFTFRDEGGEGCYCIYSDVISKRTNTAVEVFASMNISLVPELQTS